LSPGSTLPEPGDLIGGKYRVESLLGTGGMAAVFEASHVVTRKCFAIKVLLPDLTQHDGIIKRFVREAQVAGRFQHPNVVEVYDIGQEGGSFFMVMELLRGESLAARLEREVRLHASTACHILVHCLGGVAAAHAAGIIHRDLKPANIFLCHGPTPNAELPKVLDFGISKHAALPGMPDVTKTDTGRVMGTPYYMAPEQLRSAPVDERIDIYALGVTLYEMLSGRHPFEATSYSELVLKITSELPPPLETLARDLPAGLSAIVARAMARNPERRFRSATALLEALEPYGGVRRSPAPAVPATAPSVHAPASRRFETTLRTNTPLTAESVNTSERPGSWQYSRVFYVAAAGILAMLALLALGTWRSVPERRSAGAAAKPDVHVPAGTHPVLAAVSGEAQAPIPARTGHGSSVADALPTPLPTHEAQELQPSAATIAQDTTIVATSQAAETHEPRRAGRVSRATHAPAPARPPSAPPARPERPSARGDALEVDRPVRARPDPSLDRLEF
jgi:serine/threonine protein kinase